MGRLTGRLTRRLVQGLIVAWGVSTVTFVLMVNLPGDLALHVALARYGDDMTDDQAVEFVRREEGLDQSMAIRYVHWLGAALTLDLGRSLTTGESVADEVWFHYKYTFKLGACALVLSVLLAAPWGAAAGLRPGSRLDLVSAAISGSLVSIPGFVIGALLIIGLSIKIHLFPAAGFTRPENLVLPAVTLALGLAAVSSRIIRQAVVDVRGRFFITFARLKGLPDKRIFLGHGLKNAAIPVITFVGLQMAHLLDGVVVIENLFDWPGVGKMLLEAVYARDLPMLQGAALATGLTYVAVNAAVDMICLWIDPRQRAAGGDR